MRRSHVRKTLLTSKQRYACGLFQYVGLINNIKKILENHQIPGSRTLFPEECLLALLGAESLLESAIVEFSKFIHTDKGKETSV